MAEVSPALRVTLPVAAAMRPVPPALPPDAPLAEAVRAMAIDSAVLAVDAEGRPLGILTERDVARRVAFRLPPETPLGAAMTAPLITCEADSHLWRAIALLRAHALRHLPVLDRAGRCVGMLHRQEVLAAVAGRTLSHLDALAGDDAAVKAAQAGLARSLLAEGVAAPDIVRLVSGINLDLHRRVMARALRAHGAPPVGITLLVMGSAGRGESLLRPDQDNGLLLEAYGEEARPAVDAWFPAFAETLNAGLEEAGFPLCTGGIMARNAAWRGTRMEWAARFGQWARQRAGEALLHAGIAFDFIGVDTAGSVAGNPAAELRRALGPMLRAQSALLGAMAAQDRQLTVALNPWGGFRRDRGGRTDLKLGGLMPLVAATRLLALQHGVEETGTPERLVALAARGALKEGEAEGLHGAHAALLGAVLQQQLLDHEAGRMPGSRVAIAALPRAEQDRLREALRAVRRFTKAAFAGFTGEVW
ncbi:DUF294 nucleotidyltransferase-like domain-containing protein [Sabulicella glaciei]|uniref:DUF294 nucleotidyltransferase-like domain-containing protein n=1 Tax=Sabulicella glaciei TaxID=2984948 RepID=A0ABT3NXF1_9PROT|nr:DUF294 nucleotidyltransferase-like domain-containing protein [Roseococcus sp. MDT2-1-1]MCW8086803.1 DUF294 nucleotidyltransferase-like domain-containing protein [Roseococcus sp. MDT2-1-1]